MRIRFDKTAQEKLDKFEYYIKQFPYHLNESDVLEIGSGTGDMLLQLAKENPTIKYIAFEKFPTVAKQIMKKIVENNLTNLFIITGDAIDLPTLFTGKINQLWLTFSDPWPKKRHEKRRLTYKTFLDLYKGILAENGQLWFKTDNDKLYEYSLESFENNGWNIVDQTTDLHNSKYQANNRLTKYETKFKELGKNINFLIAEVKK
ncbi:tRNA (guanosine(46)-N7)-methyltransferase TrmB [Mycoplasma corogypsi]|uniref:tRNA (guanosine(46)-N7)-methyltransferase TrmB n=1 Tax=Mycoplasma corogypsi TaxID=2106 RepID=UPI003872BA53